MLPVTKWQSRQLCFESDSVSLPPDNVSRIEFAFAPSDATVAYASVVNNLGNVYNIYRSDDSGYTWRVILPGTNFVPIFLGQGVYDNAITVFPENPDKILVGGFILYQGQKIQEEGLFDWRAVSEGFTNPQFPSYLHLDNHTNVFRQGSNTTFFQVPMVVCQKERSAVMNIHMQQAIEIIIQHNSTR